MKNYVLEVCVDSVESAMNSVNGGCNRLELCSNLIIGGTTPSKALYEEVRKYCNTKIHVLIRPRFGDFLYSDYEYEIIKQEVTMFRDLGADGIVIGILKADGSLDIQKMEELIQLAAGIPIILHRAYDVCKDPYATLEQAKELGIHTILTSGQRNTCIEGKDLIAELVKQSNGIIDILVAGGVNAEVITQMYPDTKATSYHMSGRIIKESPMIYKKENVSMGLSTLNEYEIWETKEQLIREAKEVLDSIK